MKAFSGACLVLSGDCGAYGGGAYKEKPCIYKK